MCNYYVLFSVSFPFIKYVPLNYLLFDRFNKICQIWNETKDGTGKWYKRPEPPKPKKSLFRKSGKEKSCVYCTLITLDGKTIWFSHEFYV